MDQNIKIGVLAVICIILVTFVVMMFDAVVTGDYVYSTAYKQYSPSEACASVGCVWDLEVQRGMAINSPHHTPMVGCVCGKTFVYVPLLERLY